MIGVINLLIGFIGLYWVISPILIKWAIPWGDLFPTDPFTIDPITSGIRDIQVDIQVVRDMGPLRATITRVKRMIYFRPFIRVITGENSHAYNW